MLYKSMLWVWLFLSFFKIKQVSCICCGYGMPTENGCDCDENYFGLNCSEYISNGKCQDRECIRISIPFQINKTVLEDLGISLKNLNCSYIKNELVAECFFEFVNESVISISIIQMQGHVLVREYDTITFTSLTCETLRKNVTITGYSNLNNSPNVPLSSQIVIVGLIFLSIIIFVVLVFFLLFVYLCCEFRRRETERIVVKKCNDTNSFISDDESVNSSQGVLPPSQTERGEEKKLTFVVTQLGNKSAGYLKDNYPKEFKICLLIHNKIILRNIKRCKGTIGSRISMNNVIVFENPKNALRFCSSVQEDLLTPTPDYPKKIICDSKFGHYNVRKVDSFSFIKNSKKKQIIFRGIRLKMGIHCGKKYKLIYTTDSFMQFEYVGSDVRLLAELPKFAFGGQIIITDDFKTSVDSSLFTYKKKKDVEEYLHDRGVLSVYKRRLNVVKRIIPKIFRRNKIFPVVPQKFFCTFNRTTNIEGYEGVHKLWCCQSEHLNLRSRIFVKLRNLRLYKELTDGILISKEIREYQSNVRDRKTSTSGDNQEEEEMKRTASHSNLIEICAEEDLSISNPPVRSMSGGICYKNIDLRNEDSIFIVPNKDGIENEYDIIENEKMIETETLFETENLLESEGETEDSYIELHRDNSENSDFFQEECMGEMIFTDSASITSLNGKKRKKNNYNKHVDSKNCEVEAIPIKNVWRNSETEPFGGVVIKGRVPSLPM